MPESPAPASVKSEKNDKPASAKESIPDANMPEPDYQPSQDEANFDGKSAEGVAQEPIQEALEEENKSKEGEAASKGPE